MLLFLVTTWAFSVCLFLSPETPSWSPWTCLVALVTVLTGLRSGIVEPRECSGCDESCWGVEFSRGGFFGGVCCSCESEGDGRPSASPEGDGSVVFCEVWSSEVFRFNKPFDSSEMEKKKWKFECKRYKHIFLLLPQKYVVNETQRNSLMKLVKRFRGKGEPPAMKPQRTSPKRLACNAVFNQIGHSTQLYSFAT